jgi:hypothetical protein
MKIRIASTLLALMLPLAAQEPAANTEAIFYKAFYLEKGQKDFANAMVLYQQFLDQAPDHKLAKEAAVQQYGLLGTTGKTKERDAFKAKYEKLLGNAAPTPAAGDRPAGGDAPRGRGEGQGRPGGGAGGDMQARVAQLEKDLAKAKEEGNTEEVKRIEQQLERARQGGRGGNAGGGGARRGGLFGVLGNNKKISEMTAEEKTALKDAVGTFTLNDQMRERMGEDSAKKLEENVASLKKALDADKTEDAQKALDALRETMPRRGGRGGGGGGGGNGGGGGAGNGGGGGGGNGGGNGGGGGGGNSGGGGIR